MAEYATLESAYEVDADPHIRGTVLRPGGKLEFWMSIPRPEGISIDEWEKTQQAKWNRIFGGNNGRNIMEQVQADEVRGH